MAAATSSASAYPANSLGRYEPKYDSYARRPKTTGNSETGSTTNYNANTMNSYNYAPSRISATQSASYVSYGGYATLQEHQEEAPAVIRWIGNTRSYFYNSETGEIFNRAPLDFLKLLLFYACFYTGLGLLFVFCFTVFSFAVLNDDYPHRSGDNNLLHMQPGLGFRPLPDWKTTLIRFEMGKEQSFQLYTQSIQAYINQYENFANLELPDVRQTECDIERGIRAEENLKAVCKFDPEVLGNCQKQTMYGYARGLPCVMLKMNKIYGWLPEPINGTQKDILVSCSGVRDADQEFLNHVRYFPSKVVDGKEYGFFSHTFYPYLVQAGYLPPLVMAQFTNITKNRLIMVECKLGGIKNMLFDPVRRMGAVRFEILMD